MVAAVPLNVTVPVEPKFVPVIVTDVPTPPEVGERLVMLGVAKTVKVTPLLAWAPTVTTTLPVLAPLGTGATMVFALQLVGVAVVPLNVTVPVDPKVYPEMVTDMPTPPEVGESAVMLGVTVKLMLLLAWPPTVTTTEPVVAAFGTGVTILVALQLVGVAVVPLNVTVLAPCVDPKFNPEIVTEVAAGPEVTDRLVMLGKTVKLTPLLATPFTDTTTLPVVAPVGTGTVMLVALQVVGEAVVPLNVTVPVEAKFVPLIVTDVPVAPEVGDRPVIFGVNVKLTPLLACPPTVTTTFPLLAPLGTGTAMLVALQLVGAAIVPLNVTVLLP